MPACGAGPCPLPAEATSCGNLVTQMTATGHLADVAAGRELVRRSLEIKSCLPHDPATWGEAYRRFVEYL